MSASAWWRCTVASADPRHPLDAVSLVGGIGFLGLGAVGLLRAAGWIDGAAPFWALVAMVGGVGLMGAGRSLWALARPTTEGENPRI